MKFTNHFNMNIIATDRPFVSNRESITISAQPVWIDEHGVHQDPPSHVIARLSHGSGDTRAKSDPEFIQRAIAEGSRGMNLRHHEDTDSFFFKIVSGDYRDTWDIDESLPRDLVVDTDLEGRVIAIESLDASLDLGMADPTDYPPHYVWVERAHPDGAGLNKRPDVREIVYDSDRDTVDIEFAGGVVTRTVEVLDDVRGHFNSNDCLAGLSFANATRSLDLAAILADGPPRIPVVSWRVPAADQPTGTDADYESVNALEHES